MRKLAALLLALFCFTVFCTPAFAAHKNIALVTKDGAKESNAPEFTKICMDGLKMAKHRYIRSISVKMFDIKNYASEAEAIAEASKWANLVIVPTPSQTSVSAIAREYPKVTYVTLEREAEQGIKNIQFRNEEIGFLAATLAVYALQNEKDIRIKNRKVVGAIFGPDILPIQQMKFGFTTGVWYVDKNVKAIYEQVSDFSDKQAVADAARRLHAKGADIIFTAAGGAGLGASEIAEKEGFWTIGVDTEVERVYPNGVLASVVKRIDYVIDRGVDLYMQGKMPDRNVLLGAKDEVIGISLWTREAKNNVPLSIRKRVEEIEDKLISGLIILPKE